MKIAVANGDGIGPEIMAAVLKIFNANKVPLEYEFVDMGKWVFDKGFSNGMTPEAQQAIESLGLLFKGPMETPKGKGVKSINVTARKTWNTFANKRVFQTLHGVDTVFSKGGIPIDITIVRENIEDTYGGIEHMLTTDVALSRRFITRPGSMQVIRYAFEMAKIKKAKRISCGHKANIMKLTDGLFLECFYEVAKEYPELKADDIIVDDLCMKLVTRPDLFDVVVLTNLQGDIVSDLCAGLVGGLGFAPSANIGDHISIFEAVHGTAPDIAGKKHCQSHRFATKWYCHVATCRLDRKFSHYRKRIAVYVRKRNSYWRLWRQVNKSCQYYRVCGCDHRQFWQKTCIECKTGDA